MMVCYLLFAVPMLISLIHNTTSIKSVAATGEFLAVFFLIVYIATFWSDFSKVNFSFAVKNKRD